MTVRVSLFIDGFNYYYGLFKGSPIQCRPADKWLNPVLLGEAICRQSGIDGRIVRVHYCSAPALPGHNDPDQPTRQQHYFRALSGIPEVIVTLGQRRENPKTVKQLGPDGRSGVGRPYKAWGREEKGSDVNLATFLVRDAALDEFDLAFVLSNDSDLENAIRIAIKDFGKQVLVVSPKINGYNGKKARVTNQLKHVATRSFVLDHTLLAGCRLLDPTPDKAGRLVSCPKEWN